MSETSAKRYLISGVTRQGKQFRPGDWAERLAGVVTLFVGERRPGIRIASTKLAMPIVNNGIKCMIVAAEMQQICPDAFHFVMNFAISNDLTVDACCSLESDAGSESIHP